MGGYNHTGKYLKAIGTLYRNRGKNSPKVPGSQKASEEGLGSAGGALSGFIPEKKKTDNTMANAIDYQSKQAHMAQAIQMNQMADAIQRAELQAQMRQMATDQKRNIASAEAGTLSPVGNNFSHTGLKDHAVQSHKLAADIEASKRLMVGGHSLQQPPQPIPSGMGGTTTRMYRTPEDL